MEYRDGKASRIDLFSFTTAPMRAFHLSWFAFFASFLAWFAIPPLMPVIRDELHLTPEQVGNSIVASVAITIVARIGVGWLCDRHGPRIVYSWLLALGALPVMGVTLAHSYESFLLFRLAIGAIGASFVLTQFHTSSMFAPNCVGTANATTAGWGNLGGGVAQIAMPALFSLLVAHGVSSFWGWRIAMLCVGAVLPLVGVAYYFLTQDTPNGNFRELRQTGRMPPPAKSGGTLLEAASDYRVWGLALGYAACFGLEITVHNTAALYFRDEFHLSLGAAGLVAGSFGLLAIFARALGGYLSDRVSRIYGLLGRTRLLAAMLLAEGALLACFSQMRTLGLAVALLLLFGLFVHLSCGAIYAIVPFVNRKAVGSVAGLIGAGGNVGAVASGLLFKGAVSTWPHAMIVLAIAAGAGGLCALLLRFAPEEAGSAAAIPAADTATTGA